MVSNSLAARARARASTKGAKRISAIEGASADASELLCVKHRLPSSAVHLYLAHRQGKVFLKSLLHCSLRQRPRKGFKLASCKRFLASSRKFVCCPLGLGYPEEKYHALPGSAKSALCQVCLVETFAWCSFSAYRNLVFADCCMRCLVDLNLY